MPIATDRPGSNSVLKEKIIALAQRHRRYGAGMILPLKLPSRRSSITNGSIGSTRSGTAGQKAQAKKIPVADRHPLERPLAANQIWSMDFVFDRTAEGRSIRALTIVDDATHEAVAIVPERAMGGNHLVRILDQVAKNGAA